MAEIQVPNVRQETTVLLPTRLKDNGVTVNWSSLANIKAYMYSDAQRVIAGKCTVEVDGEDATVLKVTYAATRPQYLGVNSLLVRCKYHGREKSYDVPVLNFVERTAQATGVTVLDDPVIDVEIEVDEVSTSLLDGAIAAALDAAVKAEEAASLVPLQVLEDCVEATENAETATAAANEAAAAASAAGITSVQASVADNEPGTPSVDAALLNKVLSLVFHHLKGAKGDTGATPNISVGTVTTGAPGTPVVITMTGTAEAPVLNITIPQGLKGEKGDQGNTGSSVEFPYELVNNLTTNDPTKGLSAAQGVVLDGKISQLNQKIDDETSLSEDVSSSIGGWMNGGATTYAEFSLDEAGHNGTWTLLKASGTSQRIGLDCSALENGKKYRIRMTIAISDGKALNNLAASTLRTGTSNTLNDIEGNPIPFNAPGIDAIVEKTSSWSIIIVTHPASQGHTFPVTVTVSNFAVEEVATLKEATVALQNDMDGAKAGAELANEVFGKVTELTPAKQRDGYINADGTIGTAINYIISVPIPVRKGQKITIQSYIPRDCAGLALTDSSGSAYTPVIVNDSTGAVMTKDFIAPADCFVAWSYITSKTHEMFVSAAIDLYTIYGQVGEKTGILDFNPSVEFTPKFIAAKKKTNNVEPLVLLAFSDIHSKALINLPRILQFHSAHATRIDEILNLGDMVSDQYSNSFVFEQVAGAENVLSIIGNHDTAAKDGRVYDWTAHAGLDAYNKYIAPFVSNWGVTQPTGAAENGYCYYYKDYATQGIRIVFLDVMGYDATQEAWLTAVLADAKTAGLSVLAVAHYPSATATGFAGKYSLLVDNVFNRATYNPSFYGAVNVVESFITNGGKFISWLTGHLHDDFLGKLNNTNQVCLTVDTSQFGSNSASNEYDKVEGTPTQDAFSIVCIDTQAKTLSTFKVGCRRDKWQRTRDSVCVNYETATVLCEN